MHFHWENRLLLALLYRILLLIFSGELGVCRPHSTCSFSNSGKDTLLCLVIRSLWTLSLGLRLDLPIHLMHSDSFTTQIPVLGLYVIWVAELDDKQLMNIFVTLSHIHMDRFYLMHSHRENKLLLALFYRIRRLIFSHWENRLLLAPLYRILLLIFSCEHRVCWPNSIGSYNVLVYE